jgi:hypothetical protein
MEEQIPASQIPQQAQIPEGQISLEQLEQMKARAREMAIQQTLAQQAQVQAQAPAQPQVIYVRRNLTVAEILVVFLLACGAVATVQGLWNFASNTLPRIEIKVKQD